MFFIYDDSTLWFCEYNSSSNEIHKFDELKFQFPSPIYQLVSGIAHVLTLLENGNIYVWGSNYSGQLGLGDKENRSIFTQLNFPFTSPVIRLFTNYNHNFALLANGDIYGWGYNENGQLGLGNFLNQSLPKKLSFQFPSPLRNIYFDGQFTLFSLENNTYYSAGSTQFQSYHFKYGKIPNEANIYFSSPIEIFDSTFGSYVILLQSNEIFVFGVNVFNQVLFAESEIILETVKKIVFPFPASVKKICCTYDNVYALLENGQVYSLGDCDDEVWKSGKSVTDEEKRQSRIIHFPYFVQDLISDGNCIFAICCEDSNNERKQLSQIYMWKENKNSNGKINKSVSTTEILLPSLFGNMKFLNQSSLLQECWSPSTHKFQLLSTQEMIELFLQLNLDVPFLILEQICCYFCWN